MYSFNNIIQKQEPAQKGLLDNALLDRSEDGLDSTSTPIEVHRVAEADAVILRNVISPEECESLISTCNTMGFTFWANPSANAAAEPSPATDGASASAAEAASRAFRSADTIEVNLPRLSRLLWERIRPYVSDRVVVDEALHPEEYERDCEGTWVAEGFSDNLLFARYGAGGHFAPHVDGSSIETFNRRSFYTALFYLNTVQVGGETHIMVGDQCQVLAKDETSGRIQGSGANRVYTIVPIEGSCAVFKYNVLHEGAAVGEGGQHIKYIIRGDIMFRRTPALYDEPNDREAFDLYQSARIAEAEKRLSEAIAMFRRVRKLSPSIADVYQL